MAAKDIEQHRFKKGQSGNPKGRPKNLPQLDAIMVEVLSEEKGGISEAQAIIKALLTKAKRGDVKAAELLLKRAYGDVKKDIELSGDGSVLNIIVGTATTKDNLNKLEG